MNQRNRNTGPIQDEQPDFWNSPLARRDRALLDQHYANRAHGGKWKDSGNAYAIPKSQKVGLIESKIGGIPKVQGGMNNWDPRYLAAQGKVLDAKGMIQETPGSRGMDGEVDVGAIMYQRMLSQAAAPGGATHGPMPGHGMVTGQQASQQQPTTCVLQEGHTFYQALQINAPGVSFPLVKAGGQIKGLQGKQVILQTEVQAYVVDGMKTVDLSKIEPGRLKMLYKVEIPLVGSFLVPKEAILETNNGSSKQMLMDQRHYQPQQRMVEPQVPPQRSSVVVPNQYQRAQVMSQQPPRPTNSMEANSREILRKRGLLKG